MQLKHKNVIIALVSAVALTFVVAAVLKHRISVHNSADPIVNAIIEFHNPIPVKQINVLTGNEFDLLLGDGRRIHATLDVETTPLAKPRVLEFVNRCRSPRIILRKNENGIWVVDMYLTTRSPDGSEVEVSLAKWLRDKNLVYQ